MSGRRAGRSRSASGFSLLLALVVLLLVSAAAALVGESVAVRMRVGVEDGRRVDLESLADAALADALARLAADPDLSGLSERNYGRGAIWSEIQPVGAGQWRIAAGGTIAGDRRTVDAEARMTTDGLRVVSWSMRPAG